MTKYYQQNAPASVVVQELEHLFAQDKIVEHKIRVYTAATIITAILLIASIFLAAALGPIGGLFLLITLPSAIFSIVQLVLYYRRDLEDRKLLAGLKFARIIGVDLKKNSPLQIAISFENYLKHGKALTGNKRAGKFLDTWFQTHGRLADNTVFDIGVLQKVSRKTRSKRKYTKVKEAMQEIVTVQLRPIAEAFPRLDQFPQAFNEQRLAAQSSGLKVRPLDIRRAEVRNGTVHLSAISGRYLKVSGRGTQEHGKENLIDGDRILLLLLETYAALRRCKQ